MLPSATLMQTSRKPRRRRALLAPSALLLCAGVLGARLLLASSSSPARRLVEHLTGGESFSLVTLVLGDASCTAGSGGDASWLAEGAAANPELAASVGSAAVGWARKNPEAAGKIARSAVV